MKALVFERSLPRMAAARVAWKAGPLAFTRDAEEPSLPGPGWHRVRPRLAGICGSDLATVAGRSSRWFEPIVSFPFVPGHEIVGDLDDGTRVVVEPVLACAARGIDPPCEACAEGATDRCERIAFGHLQPRQFLYGERISPVVRQRTKIIEPIGIRHRSQVAGILTYFFVISMKIAKNRLEFHDALTIEQHVHPKYAMSRGVMRSHGDFEQLASQIAIDPRFR